MKTKLRKDEKVALVIKPHWLILVIPALLAIAGLVGGILIAPYGLIIPLLLFGYLGYRVIERTNNIWAVTNWRVIDEYGFFAHNSKESPLDKINNVNYHQSVWGRIFGFGDVQIQTASEQGSTVYHMVENPRSLKDTITHMQEEYKNSQILNQARELARAISSTPRDQSDVASELEKLHVLRQQGVISDEEFNAAKKKMLGM